MVAVVFVVHAVTLWGSCAVFVLADFLGCWKRYKLPRLKPHLRPDNPANLQLDREAFREAVLGTVLVVPLLVFCLYPAVDRTMAVCSELPSLRTTALHLAVMMVGCDTLFYCVRSAP